MAKKTDFYDSDSVQLRTKSDWYGRMVVPYHHSHLNAFSIRWSCPCTTRIHFRCSPSANCLTAMNFGIDEETDQNERKKCAMTASSEDNKSLDDANKFVFRDDISLTSCHLNSCAKWHHFHASPKKTCSASKVLAGLRSCWTLRFDGFSYFINGDETNGLGDWTRLLCVAAIHLKQNLKCNNECTPSIRCVHLALAAVRR